MKSNNTRSPWKRFTGFLLRCHWKLIYCVMRCVCLPFRVKAFQPDGSRIHYKINGGTLLIGNHTGFFDPIIISSAFRGRWPRYLVGEVAMDHAVTGSLLRAVGCIRVDRTICDLASMKQSIAALKNGEMLVVFPEGGIQHGQSVGAFKSGMVLMAVQANVPIIPVYISTKQDCKKGRYIVVGKAFHVQDYCSGKFPTMAEINRMTEAIHTYEVTLQDALHMILNGGKINA